MPTNEERREIASRLRNWESFRETFRESPICAALDVLNVEGYLDWRGVCELLADLIEPKQERTCMDMNEAWSDFGANVFDDDALDDFDKFEKVYQICQEIVEPLEFTCWIERTEQDEFGFYDYLSCGHIAMRQWPEKTRYCPSCGAKVVEE